jgi:hypothetical protein
MRDAAQLRRAFNAETDPARARALLAAFWGVAEPEATADPLDDGRRVAA